MTKLMKYYYYCCVCSSLLALAASSPSTTVATEVPSRSTQKQSPWFDLRFGKQRGLLGSKRKRLPVKSPAQTSTTEIDNTAESTPPSHDNQAITNANEQIILEQNQSTAAGSIIHKQTTMTAVSAATKPQILLGGKQRLPAFITSVLDFLRKRKPELTHWGMTGLKLGISVWFARTLWQAIRETIEEFDPTTEQNGIKPLLIDQVLDDLAHNRSSYETPLARLAKRLQYLTSWPLQDQEDGKASVESFLYSLTKSEYQILEQCLYVPPPDASPGSLWTSVHGLTDVQHALLDRLSSLRFCEVHNPFASVLKTNANSGILLYGPPGCGKSMMLTAICATIRMPCLVVTPSVLLKKYVGETNQQIRSLFRLAQKFGDCVICLDELDGLFRERTADEHHVVRELKTEFLQWWDGVLQQNHNSRVLLVGATNRPFEIDPAVLRRMPQSHFIGQPVAAARLVILKSLLDKIKADTDISINEIVLATEGYSPSDLVQLLHTAILQGPMREARYNGNPHGHFRALTTQDMRNAKMQVGPTPLSYEYRRALVEFHQRQHGQATSAQGPYFGGGGGGDQAVQVMPNGNFFHVGTFSADPWESSDNGKRDDGFVDFEWDSDESDLNTDDDDDDDDDDDESENDEQL